MTTLAAISTKDALIMGCDSLASVTVPMISPFDLTNFFDPQNNYELKVDQGGKPLLRNFDILFDHAQYIPYNHMTHVDKLFSLSPLEMGVMITGLASIGNFTVKNMINQFKASDKAFKGGKKPPNYTVKSISERLLEFIRKYYDAQFAEKQKPYLEFMIGGYDKQKHIPTILRIYVHDNKIEETFDNFGIVFGGEMKEIQRLVFGADQINNIKIIERSKELIYNYRNSISDILKEKNIEMEIPEPNIKDFSPFQNNWGLDGFEANWGDFSERNAIECVNFFIDIMIKSQQFSNKLPTVGGDVHLAIITKTEGFRTLIKNGDKYE